MLFRYTANRQKTNQITKLTCTVNWVYNSYLRLLFTLQLAAIEKLELREFTYI